MADDKGLARFETSVSFYEVAVLNLSAATNRRLLRRVLKYRQNVSRTEGIEYSLLLRKILILAQGYRQEICS